MTTRRRIARGKLARPALRSLALRSLAPASLALASLLAAACVPVPTHAQTFGDRTGTAASASGGLGHWMLAAQVAHPLVAGLRLGHRFDDHVRGEIGGAALPNFAALEAAARYDVLASRQDRLVPFVTGGVLQYFLTEGKEEASPLATFAAGGLEYIWPAGLSIEVQIGILKIFDSSDPDSVRRFALSEDETRTFLNVGAQYYW